MSLRPLGASDRGRESDDLGGNLRDEGEGGEGDEGDEFHCDMYVCGEGGTQREGRMRGRKSQIQTKKYMTKRNPSGFITLERSSLDSFSPETNSTESFHL